MNYILFLIGIILHTNASLQDAVVSFSHGIRVRGVMSGGILSSLARYFLTKESFFTTIVENTVLPQERDATQTPPIATVMMAPSNPGGIVLHRIGNTLSTTTTSTNTHNLLLISGAYIASDSSIVVESTRQTHAKVSAVLLSGTGYCVLRASMSSKHNEGRGERGNTEGIIAFGAYGSVHKFVLAVGEIRAVDNGHVLAWSESMTYWMDLATASSSSGGTTTSGIGNRVYNSVTSGEGLMCFFEGPGVVYVQSHKLDDSSNNTTSTNSAGRNSSSHRRSNGGGNSVCGTILGLILMFFMILIFGILPNVYPDKFGFLRDNNNNHGKNSDNYYGRSSSSSSSQQQRYNSRSQQQRYKYTREL